ncbi:MAG: hypothetical protein R3310_06975 [Candidatus Competibacteraceae bacterium]|nr:hypothetical protein [Candidatus Competibacteraceae bacterium]
MLLLAILGQACANTPSAEGRWQLEAGRNVATARIEPRPKAWLGLFCFRGSPQRLFLEVSPTLHGQGGTAELPLEFRVPGRGRYVLSFQGSSAWQHTQLYPDHPLVEDLQRGRQLQLAVPGRDTLVTVSLTGSRAIIQALLAFCTDG